MTLREKLLKRFKEREDQWFTAGAIQEWVMREVGNTGATAKRALQHMAEDGEIQVDYYTAKNGRKNAKYRYSKEESTASSYKYSYEYDPETQTMKEIKTKI